jgi:two-component system sensor histidine kinase QseC
MNSLRGRLLWGVGLVTLSLWVVLAGVAYRLEHTEMSREFDAELLHAATVFSQILEFQNGSEALFQHLNRSRQDQGLRPLAGTQEAPLMLQILRSGELVYRSDEAPNAALVDVAKGYLNASWQGRQWRTFALTHGEFVVLVAQPLAERDKLAHLASMERAGALLIFLPLWIFLGGILIAWSLLPVNALLRELGERDANNLLAVSSATLPSELRPIVEALNRVFRCLARALKLERSFTGNAAHELRTPLAAVRT